MHQGDFEAFTKVMSRLAVVYSKKLNDELVQGYWMALKDQSLTTIEDCANKHSRYGKFFPRPVELRPKDDKPGIASDGKAETAEKLSMENLEELRRGCPADWFKQVGENSRAATYANTFGVQNIWFDIPGKCWRRSA